MQPNNSINKEIGKVFDVRQLQNMAPGPLLSATHIQQKQSDLHRNLDPRSEYVRPDICL